MTAQAALQTTQHHFKDELLARNEYLVAENRILKGQLKGRLRLSDAERATLAEIGPVVRGAYIDLQAEGAHRGVSRLPNA
jgi:hypothetical protein